jgi:outer membrane autotransporter protein
VLGSGSWGDVDSTPINQGVSYKGAGVTLGYSWQSFDGAWTWGIHGGYQGAEVDTDGSLDTVDVDSFHTGVHGSYANDADDYLDLIAGYVGDKFLSQRFIDAGALDLVATGDYGADEIFVYGETGSVFELRDPGYDEHEQWNFQPQMALQYRGFNQGAHTETGAGIANLSTRKVELDSFKSYLGARVFHTEQLTHGGWIVPDFEVRWVHEFGDVDRTLTASFAATAPTFVIAAPSVDRDSAQLRVGVTTYLPSDWILDASYNADITDARENHAAMVRASYQFN